MPLTFSKLPARSGYVDEVYKVLLDAISDGSLAPATRLTQEEIAEQLAVSRYPVLQALRLLKQDGFIEDAPGRGVQVAGLNADWIAKLYDVRGALDALAARQAAKSKAVIDPAVIPRGREAAQGSNVQAMIDADMAFHTAVYEASGNPLIAASARTHWVHLRRAMGAVLQASNRRTTIWDEHQAIADAIAQGDPERAALLSDLHISRASRHLVERIARVVGAQASLHAAL